VNSIAAVSSDNTLISWIVCTILKEDITDAHYTRVCQNLICELECNNEAYFALVVAGFLPKHDEKIVTSILGRHSFDGEERNDLIERWGEARMLESELLKAENVDNDFVKAINTMCRLVELYDRYDPKSTAHLMHSVHLICDKMFGAVVLQHVSQVVEEEDEDMMLVMDNEWSPLCEFLLEKLEFCQSKMENENAEWFNLRGFTHMEFLQQYQQHIEREEKTNFLFSLDMFQGMGNVEFLVKQGMGLESN